MASNFVTRLRRSRPSGALAVCLFVCAAAYSCDNAAAQSIDLSLNLLYTNPSDVTEGGTWQVVGKSTGQGIQGIAFAVQGVSSGALNAPVGRVNGVPIDNAGFDFTDVTTRPGNVFDFFAFQGADLGGPDADAFYGFGTQSNATPTTIGPSYASLTALRNSPWSVGVDVFGETEWNNAAIIASGTFSGVTIPSFVLGDQAPAGSVWTTVGTASSRGSFVDGVTVTTIVRDQLPELTADYNQDGRIDAIDYAVWRETLGDTVTPGSGADGSGNGTVDTADFELWRDNYGVIGAPPASFTASPVPAPGSGLFLSLFVMGIGLLRRGRLTDGSPTGIFQKNQQYREKLLDTKERPSHNAAS